MKSINMIISGVACFAILFLAVTWLDGYSMGRSYKRQVCASDISHELAQKMIRHSKVDIVYRGKVSGYSASCDDVL